MPRPKGKLRRIAYNIIGPPENSPSGRKQKQNDIRSTAEQTIPAVPVTYPISFGSNSTY